ncbi:UDP-N-acetylmuramate dehydrogenase [Porphyromonas sp.]|uniref:UDP-N-acetylmuramate dehydrogenase n=1 Tax=Porphyromonas sp. TaxID=1924944 RepID=UPI0026DC60D0|nr:UDP-N-acetylmuramate dehydrogenase [Porphyromonas sp.]MDO4695339.1 UDP-N-acetylmuramate dehydrogenase [Porphyromonas sp.]MDO4771099.1 UDP-N-acetylmuramate dehydrogenase [Porphyromonas sp.]
MHITADFDLKQNNTFAISAKASYFITCESVEDIQRLCRDEFFRSQPYLIVGGGSNLLFTEDFNGCIVRFTGQDWRVVAEDDAAVTVQVEAGRVWHDLVMEIAEKGYWGIENLALIPGDCGAAAVQNIGAYGVEICQVLTRVYAVDLRDGSLRAFSGEECKYGYRYSVFKERNMGHYFIYAIELRLSKNPNPQLSYAGLQGLSEIPQLTPKAIAEHVIGIRETKLPDPKDLPNAGSFFMNPIVDSSVYERITGKYGKVPYYAVGDHYKIPAAWLIEQCGFKGKAKGRVGCYEKQPLVIVNHGGATGEDVVAWSIEIQDAVKKQFGISLHPEVKFVKTLSSNLPLGK